MKRYYYAATVPEEYYNIDPSSVEFKNHEPHIKIFTSAGRRNTYVVEGPHDAWQMPARLARYWIEAYVPDSWCMSYTEVLRTYLRLYPQNDGEKLFGGAVFGKNF